jgi:hypothetical protein
LIQQGFAWMEARCGIWMHAVSSRGLTALNRYNGARRDVTVTAATRIPSPQVHAASRLETNNLLHRSPLQSVG